MRTPKEDPEARREREREMRRSRQERVASARENVTSMTGDYRSVYGRPSLLRAS